MPKTDGVDHPDDDDEFEGSASKWHIRVGKRLGASLEFMCDPRTLMIAVSFAVALTPLQYVFAWMLETLEIRCADPLSPTKPIPLLDLMFPPASPAHLVLQYYGQCLLSPVGKFPAFGLLVSINMRREGRIRLLRMLWSVLNFLAHNYMHHRDNFCAPCIVRIRIY